MYSLAKDIKSIESIALGILSKLDIDELSKIEKKLIAISADGKVDKGEMGTLQEIRDYFSSLQEKISELSLLCDKGKADEDDGWC
jgi:hypothetical protein